MGNLSRIALAILVATLAPAAAAQEPQFCGGELSPAKLSEFTENLRAALARDKFPLDAPFLFAAHVTLVAEGAANTLPRSDLGQTKQLPTRADWNTILSLLETDGLEPVGWRGCILGAGKASFEASGDGTFGLRSFDLDRPWEAENL